MIQTKEELQKYDYIDSLRGIAIVMVFMTHLRQHVDLGKGFLDTASIYGQHGVQLFFLVSSYTLCISIISRKTLDRPAGVYNYFIRRYFRIAPLYYVAIFIYGLRSCIFPLSTFPNKLPVMSIITNLTFTHGFFRETISSIPPGGWSIAAEFLFYLSLPKVLSRISGLKSSLYVLLGGVTFSIICKIFGRLFIESVLVPAGSSLLAEEGWFFYFWFPWQFPVFLLGIFTFFLSSYTSKGKSVVFLFPILSAIFIYLGFMVSSSFNRDLYYPSHWIFSIGFMFFLLFLKEYSFRILVNRFTVLLGKISFGFYLFHFIIFDTLDYVGANNLFSPFTYGFLSFGASCCFSYLTYQFIEKRGANFGKALLKG